MKINPTLPILCAAVAFAAATSSGSAGQAIYGSANWAQANLAQLEGKRVTLNVSHCRPGQVDGAVQWVTLFTPEDRDSSTISACILAADMKPLFTRVGSVPREDSKGENNTTPVAGILRRDNEGKAYLDLGVGTQGAQNAAGAVVSSSARIWTALDGRTVVADYVSKTETSVRVRRTNDGQIFNIELATLSQADREWVAANR